MKCNCFINCCVKYSIFSLLYISYIYLYQYFSSFFIILFYFHIYIFFFNFFLIFLLEPGFNGPIGNPCLPSPCGPYSQCKLVGNAPACSCLPNYIGIAPNCRPECSINAECPGNLACQNEKCVDPCPGSCGFNAECSVANHVALCNCVAGYTGDPFSGCTRMECK